MKLSIREQCYLEKDLGRKFPRVSCSPINRSRSTSRSEAIFKIARLAGNRWETGSLNLRHLLSIDDRDICYIYTANQNVTDRSRMNDLLGRVFPTFWPNLLSLYRENRIDRSYRSDRKIHQFVIFIRARTSTRILSSRVIACGSSQAKWNRMYWNVVGVNRRRIGCSHGATN